MEVYLLSYECFNSDETGVLALYSNRDAANDALQYAESLCHYYKLYIEVCFVQEKFSTTDFD